MANTIYKRSKNLLVWLYHSLVKLSSYLPCVYCWLGMSITLLFSNFAHAGLPKAPSIPGLDNSNNYLKIGAAVGRQGANLASVFLYIIGAIIYCSALLWGFNNAKEERSWGNFIKTAVIGLIVMLLVIIILDHVKGAISGLLDDFN